MAQTDLPPQLPTRVVRLDAARRSHGAALTPLLDGLHEQDPLADAWVAHMSQLPRADAWRMTNAALTTGAAPAAAPLALRELVDMLWDKPAWLDQRQLATGGTILLRAGLLGGMILGLRSLVLGYAAPAGNKPLVLSGMLERQTARRLHETTRFVQAVSSPGGMERGADGFVITARVRLMHAQVRQLVRASGRWDDTAWGAPINQHDMLATILLFSTIFIQGLAQLGLNVDPREAEDMVHLWRYVGHIIGVRGALAPTSVAHALTQQAMIDATQEPPDEDARRLTRALLRPPPGVSPSPQRAAFIHGLFRSLNGDVLADQLAIPQSVWTGRIQALRPIIQRLDSVRAQARLCDMLTRRLGGLYWHNIVSMTQGAQQASFSPPAALGEAS